MTIRRPVPSVRDQFRRAGRDAAGHGGRLKATRPPGRDGSNVAFAAAGAPDCNTGEKVGRPTADTPFRLLRKTFNTPADRPSVFHAILGQECIHIVADPVAKVVADAPHRIKAAEHGIPLRDRQGDRDFERVPKHPHQGAGAPVVLQTDLVAKARRAFAKEHHQLRQSFGPPGGLFVIRDRLPGGGN